MKSIFSCYLHSTSPIMVEERIKTNQVTHAFSNVWNLDLKKEKSDGSRKGDTGLCGGTVVGEKRQGIVGNKWIKVHCLHMTMPQVTIFLCIFTIC